MQKKVNPIGKADFRRRKTKDVGMFFFWFKTEAIIYPNLCITKSRENSGKIQFGRNQRNIRFHHSQLYLWEWKLSDNFISSFSFRHAKFFFFVRCIEFLIWTDIGLGLIEFHLMPFFWYLDSIKQLLGSFGSSSWILSSVLHCEREVRASNLKHKHCFFIICKLFCGRHYWQLTWFTFSSFD